MTEYVFSIPLEPTAFRLPSIAPGLDSQFAGVYRHFSEHTRSPTTSFDSAASIHFDSLTALSTLESAGAADMYFNSFTPIWVWLMNQGRYRDAASVWDWAVRPVLQWEARSGQPLHKGSAFYFAAITALLQDDLDGGFLLAHAALEEDVRTHGHLNPQTPSLALAVLDPEPFQQLFRQWVAARAATLDAWLVAYRDRHGRTLSLARLRQYYLLAPLNRENAFLLAYCVARLERLASLPAVAKKGVFASQLHANLLFDLVLLLDQAIPCVEAKRPTFIHLAAELSAKASLGLSRPDLRALNDAFNDDFDSTVVAVLDGVFRLPDGRALTSLAAALAVSYGCRNRGAHSTAASPVASTRFDDVLGAVLDCFFLAVESVGIAAPVHPAASGTTSTP